MTKRADDFDREAPMPHADRASVFATMRAWLINANADAASVRLDPDTDIIESRILDSLQLVEFVLFLEEASGRAILGEDLDPNTLRTLASIHARYFERRP